MDPQAAKSLFERLVRQHEYPGDVCPAEHTLAGYLAGALSDVERRRLDEHLAECDGCRSDLTSLAAASQWLDEHQDALLARALDRAQRSGLLSLPTPQELELYAWAKVPQSPQGQKLRERVEAAMASDVGYRAEVTRLKDLLTGLIVISLAELPPSGASPRQPELRSMLTALAALARVQAARRRPAAMPGHRSAGDEPLAAMLLDAAGQPVLDDQGRPAAVDFHIVRAAIERDGRAVIDLSTTQAAYWQTPQQTYEVVVTLTHENWQLVLPPEKIYAGGRATVVAKLTDGIEIDPLPREALRLEVRPI